MADQYLLPCPCGRKTVVAPRIAGQIIPCACGNPLEVPTLLAMTQLQRVETPPGTEPQEPSWGAWQRVGIIGWMALVLALTAACYVIINRPVSPQDQIDLAYARAMVDAGLNNASPADTLKIWRLLRNSGLGDVPEQVEKGYRDSLARYHFALVGSLLAALVGFAMVLGAHQAVKRGRLRGPTGEP